MRVTRELQAYSWPGNIRQLYTVCFELFRLAFSFSSERPVISIEDIRNVLKRQIELIPEAQGQDREIRLPVSMETYADDEAVRRKISSLRKDAVQLAAEAGGFVPAKGARFYGCHSQTFKNLMSRHNIKPRTRSTKRGSSS